MCLIYSSSQKIFAELSTDLIIGRLICKGVKLGEEIKKKKRISSKSSEWDMNHESGPGPGICFISWRGDFVPLTNKMELSNPFPFI